MLKKFIFFFFQKLISIRSIHLLFYKFLPDTKYYHFSNISCWNKKSLISFVINKLARLKHPRPIFKNIVIHDTRTINLSLDITEFTSSAYYLGLVSEPLLKLISCRKGGAFIDIGANIGFYSLMASNYFHRVYSFEPVSFNHEKLIVNIKNNNIKNIIPIKKALGEKQAEMMMFLNPQNAGGNSLLDKKGESWRDPNLKEKVLVDTLDQILNFKDVKLIKIDVEGFEEFVIKGGKKLLDKHKPAIFLEVNEDLKRAQRILNFCPNNYVYFNSAGTETIENDMIYCDKSEAVLIKKSLMNDQ
ncbi:FkbM family methyltransferase [Alphaproteobacteria bacterium]|nr:FkbM family methyltransferase [Alphaproteobacteria bacterium]